MYQYLPGFMVDTSMVRGSTTWNLGPTFSVPSGGQEIEALKEELQEKAFL